MLIFVRFAERTDGNTSLFVANNGSNNNVRDRSSLVIISLVEHLAAAYEQSEERRSALVVAISQSLIKTGVINPAFAMPELSGLRAQYSVAFLRLMAKARTELPVSKPLSLLGPDHNLASHSNLPTFFKSRYKQDFEEKTLLGRGGFGSVYLAVNRLDKATYAVKKIHILLSKVNLAHKILREVHVLAKLSHPNIVSYKTAWTEAYFGEVSSNESSRNHQSSHSFEEIDDDEDESEEQSDNREGSEESCGVVFDRQSAVITEVSGSPSGWSSGVQRVVGRPSSPQSTMSRRQLAGKFWRSTNTEFSQASVSASVQFNQETSGGDKNNRAMMLLQRSNSLEADVAQAATLYIQMELCQSTLREWLDSRNMRGVISSRDNYRIFRQLLLAAQYLHDQGILHRDIKPRNIFVNDNLLIKLGDFGLAKEDLLLSPTEEPATPAQELQRLTFMSCEDKNTSGVGTTAYAAPEQLSSGHIDRSSDMYSLGVVLFELFIVTNTEMERVVCINKLRDRARSVLDIVDCPYQDIPDTIWRLTSPVLTERPTASFLLEEMFSDKDITVLERDREMDMLRDTIRLQTSQINKQEQLIAQQNKEIEILRKLLSRQRTNIEEESNIL